MWRHGQPSVASIRVDVLLNWSQSQTGLVTTTTLSNAILGAGVSGQAVSNPTRWSIINTNGATPAFPSSITINGTNWNGVGTNWLYNNCNAGSGYEFLQVNLPGYPRASLNTNCLVCGYAKFLVTNSVDNEFNLDQWVLYKSDSNGDFSVMQVQPRASGVDIHDHSSTAPDSTNAFCTSVTFGQTYFIMLYQDTTNQTTMERVYTGSAPYSLVAQTNITSDPRQYGTYLFQLPSGYIGDVPGYAVYGPLFLVFNPSWAQIDGIVTNGN